MTDPQQAPAPAQFTYVDVAALLKDGAPPRLQPTVGKRTDNTGVFYRGKVNCVYGPPESGKTLFCLNTIVQALTIGQTVAVIDADENGAAETIYNLIELRIGPDVLSDPARFRLYIPEDESHVRAAVIAVAPWAPTIVLLDSYGAIMRHFKFDQDKDVDTGKINEAVYLPLMRANCAVVYIDHVPKNVIGEPRTGIGSGGKHRDVNGVSYYIAGGHFDRKRGGRTSIRIGKDKPGWVREHSVKAEGNRLQHFANFVIDPGGRTHLYQPDESPDPKALAQSSEAHALFDSRVAEVRKLGITGVAQIRRHFGIANESARLINLALKPNRDSVTTVPPSGGVGNVVTIGGRYPSNE